MKEQAIAALVSHKNVESAARAIGISPTTLQRWTKDPEFAAACREAQSMAYHDSIARLKDAAGAAVTTVLKIMLDLRTPAATRLRAAEIVLNNGAKATEIDLEARVAELERGRSAKRSIKGAAIVTLIERHGVSGPATMPEQIPAPSPRLAAPKRRK